MGKTDLYHELRKWNWKHLHVRGEDRHVEAAMGGTPKHPHVRGEDKIEASREGLSLETPPRAWGRLWVHCCDIGGSRNTPTCVGKTSPLVRNAGR